MPTDMTQSFRGVVAAGRAKGSLEVALPFDPDAVWGAKKRHHVAGTVAGHRVRAVIDEGATSFTLGALWARDCPVDAGDTVEIVLWPEGPQRDDLADDVAAALADDPAAGAFFDSLAQFYRRGYLSWIDATKRSPELRAQRIADVVKLCHDGIKQRPR
jgi:hypothetical protein